MSRGYDGPMADRSPSRIFWIVALILIGGGTGLGFAYGIPIVIGYLATITLTTFLFYGIDKSKARKERRRIPERVLHWLTFLGGTVGAILGQKIFRHKTVKKPFRLAFIAIVVLQVVLLGGWLYGWLAEPAWFPESLRFIFPA